MLRGEEGGSSRGWGWRGVALGLPCCAGQGTEPQSLSPTALCLAVLLLRKMSPSFNLRGPSVCTSTGQLHLWHLWLGKREPPQVQPLAHTLEKAQSFGIWCRNLQLRSSWGFWLSKAEVKLSNVSLEVLLLPNALQNSGCMANLLGGKWRASLGFLHLWEFLNLSPLHLTSQLSRSIN